jgi:signal transduction histidine kinase
VTCESGEGEGEGVSEIIRGRGEVASLLRARDWSSHPLGPLPSWPPALLRLLNLMLECPYAMSVIWGPRLFQFYNDSYRPMLGSARHPFALGTPLEEVWPELWDAVGPLLNGVLATCESIACQDAPFEATRYGYPEAVYFTFSYSPIRDEAGDVAGVLAVVTETTQEVVSRRRLQTLYAVSAETAAAPSPKVACESAVRALAGDPAVSLAAVYLTHPSGTGVELTASMGPPPGRRCFPRWIDLVGGAPAVWPLARPERGTGWVAGTEPLAVATPQHAVVVPLLGTGQPQPLGYAVIGLDSRRPYDAEYAAFIHLLAEQLAASVRNARAREVVRREAEHRRELARQQERERIAMDLHDHVVQALFGATLSLRAVEERLRQDVPEAAVDLARTRGQVQGAVRALREYVRGPRPRRAAAGGLAAGLHLAIAEFAVGGAPAISVTCDESVRLPSNATAHVLAVTREATTNAVRHAQARTIVITAKRSGGRFELRIRDDGCGFLPGAGRGIGLRNMAQRARALGGELVITRPHQGGTLVTLRCPLGDHAG